MKTGEKIRRLRNEKLMTQSQLAGTRITRNMLSKIENGEANPSLPTLEYIAQRLNVSVGFLLADAEDDMIYRKNHELFDIKRAYASGNMRLCREMAQKSDITDDETELILAQATFSVALEEFGAGNLKNACRLFDEALSYSENTVYYTGHILSASALYFRYMRTISQTLSSEIIDEYDVEYYSAMHDRTCFYMVCLENLEKSAPGYVEQYIKSGEPDDPYVLHLGAKVNMKSGDFRAAYTKLYRILISQVEINEPLMYAVLCDLEICCRETEDFKGAYEYSLTKIDLMQRLLSE
ncbi:MAG: helix-turn-helix domain-containing protein [Eubacteriales bacterium]